MKLKKIVANFPNFLFKLHLRVFRMLHCTVLDIVSILKCVSQERKKFRFGNTLFNLHPQISGISHLGFLYGGHIAGYIG